MSVIAFKTPASNLIALAARYQTAAAAFTVFHDNLDPAGKIKVDAWLGNMAKIYAGIARRTISLIVLYANTNNQKLPRTAAELTAMNFADFIAGLPAPLSLSGETQKHHLRHFRNLQQALAGPLPAGVQVPEPIVEKPEPAPRGRVKKAPRAKKPAPVAPPLEVVTEAFAEQKIIVVPKPKTAREAAQLRKEANNRLEPPPLLDLPSTPEALAPHLFVPSTPQPVEETRLAPSPVTAGKEVTRPTQKAPEPPSKISPATWESPTARLIRLHNSRRQNWGLSSSDLKPR